MNIPGYEILKQIGQGGMSTVYLALQKSLLRKVALKVLSPALVADTNFCERFLKEGKIIAQLSHPHIVSIIDIGHHKSTYYMSMEYISGGDLKKQIRKGIDEEHSIQVILKIAKALGYAHDRGFVHRDVKPQNILFRNDDTPVLTDFGIAKSLGDSGDLTRLGQAFGSPRYMSPEQVRGKELSFRSDLYSLGILMFEMLSGNPPFSTNDAGATARMHLIKPVPKLPTDYAKYQKIINHLLAKSPDERYPNAWELIAELQQTASDAGDATFDDTVEMEFNDKSTEIMTTDSAGVEQITSRTRVAEAPPATATRSIYLQATKLASEKATQPGNSSAAIKADKPAAAKTKKPENQPTTAKTKPENKPATTKAKKPKNKPSTVKTKKPRENKPATAKAKKPKDKPTTVKTEKPPENKPATAKAKKPEDKPSATKAIRPENNPAATKLKQSEDNSATAVSTAAEIKKSKKNPAPPGISQADEDEINQPEDDGTSWVIYPREGAVSLGDKIKALITNNSQSSLLIPLASLALATGGVLLLMQFGSSPEREDTVAIPDNSTLPEKTSDYLKETEKDISSDETEQSGNIYRPEDEQIAQTPADLEDNEPSRDGTSTPTTEAPELTPDPAPPKPTFEENDTSDETSPPESIESIEAPNNENTDTLQEAELESQIPTPTAPESEPELNDFETSPEASVQTPPEEAPQTTSPTGESKSPSQVVVPDTMEQPTAPKSATQPPRQVAPETSSIQPERQEPATPPETQIPENRDDSQEKPIDEPIKAIPGITEPSPIQTTPKDPIQPKPESQEIRQPTRATTKDTEAGEFVTDRALAKPQQQPTVTETPAIRPTIPPRSKTTVDSGIIKKSGRYIISPKFQTVLEKHALKVTRLRSGSVKLSFPVRGFFPAGLQLSNQAKRQLSEIAFILRNFSGYSITVIDRSRLEGQAGDGLEIDRAKQVSSYLVAQKISPERIHAILDNPRYAASPRQGIEIFLAPSAFRFSPK
jgi:serine/threonine protein kinase